MAINECQKIRRLPGYIWILENVRQTYASFEVERKSGNGSYKWINKIDNARAKRKNETGDTAMSSGWILLERIHLPRRTDAFSDALARMRHSTGHDAMRRTVIVFYWCHAVPSRLSLARPTSKATIPATSAPEAARRVACRKWSHRCRVLINQISTTIKAIMRHSDLFQRSVCLWFHSPLDFSVDLSLSVSKFFLKGLQKSSNSHKFSLIVRVRLAQAGNPDITNVFWGRLVGDTLFISHFLCYPPL